MDLKSRKFLMTLVYAALLIANDVFNLGITTETFAFLATALGVYFTANVVEKSKG